MYIYSEIFHTLRPTGVLFLLQSLFSAIFPISSPPNCSYLIPSCLCTLLKDFFQLAASNVLSVHEYDIPTSSYFSHSFGDTCKGPVFSEQTLGISQELGLLDMW